MNYCNTVEQPNKKHLHIAKVKKWTFKIDMRENEAAILPLHFSNSLVCCDTSFLVDQAAVAFGLRRNLLDELLLK